MRAEVKKPGPLADDLNKIMSSGKLVPSDLVVKLMKKVNNE